MSNDLPSLEAPGASATREAIHAYSKILGDWLKACRPKRKHWWHASLRPSLRGLTTGVVHAGVSFELELDLCNDQLRCSTASKHMQVPLDGRPPAELSKEIEGALVSEGLDPSQAPTNRDYRSEGFPGYAPEHARALATVLNSVFSTLSTFRAGIREETSPIQLWPHHFDLSMIWLPGDKIPGQDPDDEEYADKQMNFGFAFGDDFIPEAYFYVTAYPSPEAFNHLEMPGGTEWCTEGFVGAVTRYSTLRESQSPHEYLLSLCNRLLTVGREYLTRD